MLKTWKIPGELLVSRPHWDLRKLRSDVSTDLPNRVDDLLSDIKRGKKLSLETPCI